MSDRIRKIQESLKKGSGNGDEITAAIAYVPLFGWAYAITKDDDFTRFHALQARDLNLAIVVIYLIVWFVENFPLTSWLFGANRFLNPVSQALWVVSVLGYLAFSGYAAYRAIMDERWSVPFIEEVRDRVQKILRREK
jgi:uncharacterized membrane protein